MVCFNLCYIEREHLSAVLLDKVQSEDPQWKDSGRAFISSVTRLLERLLDYRSVIQGDENRDKRMSCTVNLLNFYKNEINRKEMYIRYIHKLHDLHKSAENYLEAGFTMKLYADQLSWSTRHLPADLHYQVQLEWQRKEEVYLTIIKYFDRGKAWEKGIPLCKELANLYETKLFDYKKLSDILLTQAKFYENILHQLRPEPEYFRVGFYGLSFPLFVRNKVFIYRGLEYERIGAFTQRLQTEFPSAQILTKNTPPDETIVNSDGQFIQICNVKPLNENNVIFQGICEAPEKIASYYEVNDISRFQLDRPVHRGPVDKDNEFKSLWIERSILTTSNPLPGILRWFEVMQKTIDCIPPVQYACETMEAKNRELRQLIQIYTADPKKNINPFSMLLQGIIDANVMGGIVKYQQAFFIPEFAQQHPQYLPFIHRLKSLLQDQIQVLESGLILHGKLCPSGVQPLHKRLQERYLQLRQSLREMGGRSIVNTPLPPLPFENKKTGQYDRYSNTSSVENFYEDDVYSRPNEGNGSVTPPLPHRKTSGSLSEDRPPKPTHQRSLSKPLSPRSARHATADDTSSAGLRNSWSEETRCDAPPLPPRGLTPDKRGGFLLDGQLPSIPPKRPVSAKSGNSLFFVDMPLDLDDASKLGGGEPCGGSGSSVDATLRTDLEKDEMLRDSGCFPDARSDLATPSFNNLSYEDYELKSRLSGTENLNIQMNGEPGEEKTLNTCEGASVDSPPAVDEELATPPPIPPKSLLMNERRDSLDSVSTPNSVLSMENGSKNENYSVPRLHNK